MTAPTIEAATLLQFPLPCGIKVDGELRREVRDHVVDRYTSARQPASIRDLADEIGRCYSFVHTLLTEAGVPLRPAGAHGWRKNRSADF